MYSVDFSEKLQALRKSRQLTQEEVAQALFVSRTAVSKWESGRGYPGIDSLKAIARFYSVSIDELLSGNDMLILAEADQKQWRSKHLSKLFGLLDCSSLLLLFLPFFGSHTGQNIREVSLIQLNGISQYLHITFFVSVISMVLWGILLLALQNWQHPFWKQHKFTFSFVFHIAGTLLFISSRQPYAAIFLFVFLMIKAVFLHKKS